METQPIIDTKSLLGSSANFVSDHLKLTYNAFQLPDPEKQYLVDNYHFHLQKTWGVKKLDQFPDELKTLIENARSSILALKSDFEHEPKGAGGLISIFNNDIHQWIKQVLAHVQLLEKSYLAFLETTQRWGKTYLDIFTKLFTISPTSAAFWLKHFLETEELSASEFADALVNFFEKDMDQDQYVMEKQDKQTVKSFLITACSQDKEGKIVDLDSFRAFLLDRNNEHLKKEGLKLGAVIEHALDKKFPMSPSSPGPIPYTPISPLMILQSPVINCTTLDA